MFESLAALLMPADSDRGGAAVLADDRWRFETAGLEADVVVWGRPPLPASGSLWTAATSAAARERAVRHLRLRPPRPWRMLRAHRWPPARLIQVPARDQLRATLLGGALVELTTGASSWRVCDGAAAAAGIRTPIDRFAVGSGGSILARQRMPDGSEAVLRVGMAGCAADPSHGVAALQRLAGAAFARVPRVLGHGRTAGASWSLESGLRGRRPNAVSNELFDIVLRFCTQLPVSAGAPTAHRQDLKKVTEIVPESASLIEQVSRWLDRTVASLPAVMRHGDLWVGNILVDRDGLAGVIDWDAWQETAIPGIDLLHLLGMDRALRTRQELGQVWLGRPWLSPAFQRATERYWSALDVHPAPETLEAVGLGWWAAYVAHTVGRDPAVAADHRWVRLNVRDVLAAVEQDGVISRAPQASCA